MSSTTLFVVGSLFQWAGKFASVAVAEALEGKVAWDEVGDHGVHLAIVDLMLQWYVVKRGYIAHPES